MYISLANLNCEEVFYWVAKEKGGRNLTNRMQSLLYPYCRKEQTLLILLKCTPVQFPLFISFCHDLSKMCQSWLWKDIKNRNENWCSKHNLNKAVSFFFFSFFFSLMKNFQKQILGSDIRDQSTAHRIKSIKDHKWSQLRQTGLFSSFYQSH